MANHFWKFCQRLDRIQAPRLRSLAPSGSVRSRKTRTVPFFTPQTENSLKTRRSKPRSKRRAAGVQAAEVARDDVVAELLAAARRRISARTEAMRNANASGHRGRPRAEPCWTSASSERALKVHLECRSRCLFLKAEPARCMPRYAMAHPFPSSLRPVTSYDGDTVLPHSLQRLQG